VDWISANRESVVTSQLISFGGTYPVMQEDMLKLVQAQKAGEKGRQNSIDQLITKYGNTVEKSMPGIKKMGWICHISMTK
jgi:hypothetical protein